MSKSEQDVSRRDLLKAAGAAAVAGAVGLSGCANLAAVTPAQARPAAPPPTGRFNIIFILTGQERHFDEFPRGMRLPGRERLMRDGVTFTNHQICAAVCTPSRSVIYTGQHIQHTGCFDNSTMVFSPDLPTDFPNIGHILRGLDPLETIVGALKHYIRTGQLPPLPQADASLG